MTRRRDKAGSAETVANVAPLTPRSPSVQGAGNQSTDRVRLPDDSINDTPLNGLAEPASDASAVDPHIGMLPRLHWKHMSQGGRRGDKPHAAVSPKQDAKVHG